MFDKKTHEKEYGKKRRAKSKSLGLCIICHSVPFEPGLVVCLACKIRRNKFKNSYRKSDLGDGVCVNCREAKLETRWHCKECAEKLTERNSLRREVRTEQGRCIACSNEIVDGSIHCQDHLDRFKAHDRKRDKTLNRRLLSLKARDAKAGKICDITFEVYTDLLSRPCEYCTHVNTVTNGAGLDRLDNTLGHSIGNVVSCCSLCNITRGNRLSPKEMKEVGEVISRIKITRAKDTNKPCHPKCNICLPAIPDEG